MEGVRNFTEVVEPRNYQVDYSVALAYKIIDLFKDNDAEKKLISRADIMLILSLYDGGLKEFLEDYKNHIRELNVDRGYRFVPKPHYYLKSLLG